MNHAGRVAPVLGQFGEECHPQRPTAIGLAHGVQAVSCELARLHLFTETESGGNGLCIWNTGGDVVGDRFREGEPQQPVATNHRETAVEFATGHRTHGGGNLGHESPEVEGWTVRPELNRVALAIRRESFASPTRHEATEWHPPPRP